MHTTHSPPYMSSRRSRFLELLTLIETEYFMLNKYNVLFSIQHQHMREMRQPDNMDDGSQCELPCLEMI